MAQNITLMGASYSDVPAVTLPKTGGGTETFTDTTDANAAAADIAQGKTAFVNGTKITGTASGGGIGTLLQTTSLGSFNTSSSSATDTGKTVTVKGVYDYDALIVETSVDSVVNGRHLCTVGWIWLTASSAVATKNGSAIGTAKLNMKASSNGTVTTRSSTTARGIYPYSCTISAGSTGDNGQAVIAMYICYNSTQTGTINNSYTTRVYGVKLYELIGG